MGGLFLDECGKLSSTRVFGAFCLLLGGLLACLKQAKEAQALLTAGVTLLSAGQAKGAVVQVGASMVKKEEVKSDGNKVKVAEDI